MYASSANKYSHITSSAHEEEKGTMTVTVRRGSNKQEHPRTPSATSKMNK
jgi:hypothetical protein